MVRLNQFLPVLILFISILYGCEKEVDDPPDGNNDIPQIGDITLTASPDSVGPGESTTLICDANDPSGELFDYFWYAQKGFFPGADTGSTVTWTAPGEIDRFKIHVVVSNGDSAATRSIAINDLQFTDSRDGNEYTYTQLGTQVWMTENLAYLPEVSLPAYYSDSSARYYVYDYDGYDVQEAKNTDNYQKYGILYNWEAALKTCPEGWYLPTNQDWKTLEKFIEDNTEPAELTGWRASGIIGKKLKSESGWKDGRNGDGSFDFNALPGGFYRNNGQYLVKEESAYFWTSNPFENLAGVFWRMSYSHDGIEKRETGRSNAMSVRCIKERRDSNTPPVAKFTISPEDGNESTIFELDASLSYDNETPKELLSVRWNWSKDGVWDTYYEYNKTVKFQFLSYGEHTIRLEVRDDRGMTNIYSNTVYIPEGHEGDGYITDERDGNTYDYKIIGDQTWLIENMAYLPKVTTYWFHSTTEKFYYVYDFYTENGTVLEAKANENYKKYGVLYNWEAALDACPDGWHLPSDDEWEGLKYHLGMDTAHLYSRDWNENDSIGYYLKSEYGWLIDGNGDNRVGFNALPAGKYWEGKYRDLTGAAIFWTSTGISRERTWREKMTCNREGLERYWSDRNDGLSVRCIKDQ